MKVQFLNLVALYDSIKPEIDENIQAVLNSQQFIKGPFLDEFEAALASYLGVNHAIGCSSGTSALHVALLACGVKPGSEVVTAANTFFATVEAIDHAQCKPVLVDIERAAYTLDPNKVRTSINENTGAVIPVHLYGRLADLEPLIGLASSHGLPIIEDAAQAIGAVRNGYGIGQRSACATISFFPGKNLGAFGDAGAIVTQDDTVAKHCRQLIDHGRLPGEKYLHASFGYNYRMDALQAAVLTVKLRHLSKWNERRRQIARQYYSQLKETSLILPIPDDGTSQSVHHLYVVRCAERDKLQRYLKTNGVDTGIHYPVPIHLQPATKEMASSNGPFPIAESTSKQILSLPIDPMMSDEAVNYVCLHVRAFLEEIGAQAACKETSLQPVMR